MTVKVLFYSLKFSPVWDVCVCVCFSLFEVVVPHSERVQRAAGRFTGGAAAAQSERNTRSQGGETKTRAAPSHAHWQINTSLIACACVRTVSAASRVL